MPPSQRTVIGRSRRGRRRRRETDWLAADIAIQQHEVFIESTA